MTFLTGIKPTGDLHLGNYISAIKPILDIDDDCYFFIADYHALTTHPHPKIFKQNCIDLSAALCSFFGESSNVKLYRQSQIPQIFEFYYILNCFMSKGFLNRAHAYKTVVDENISLEREEDTNVFMGLFTYPTLMSADILLFQPDYVPVGYDQKQHMEIVEELCRKLNHFYKRQIIKKPQTIYQTKTSLVGTDGRKMSKSYNNIIPLFGSKKKVKKLVFSICTNSKNEGEPKFEGESEVTNLYKVFSSVDEYNVLLEDMKNGLSWKYVKERTYEKILELTGDDRREKFNYLRNNPNEIELLLNENEIEMKSHAETNLQKIKSVIGIL